MKQRRPEQVDTVGVPVTTVVLQQRLRRGRQGRTFDWRVGGNDTNASWAYECGRLLAHIAPLSIPLRIGSKLNAKAVALCKAAFNRSLIV